jgi:hypothetical protein
MSAIVTDQFRILNASNFIDSVSNSPNSYYVFVGLTNSSPSSVGYGRTDNWDSNIPNPIDSIDNLNHTGSTILYGKKITSANIRRVVKKISWVSGKRYEMYRQDYSILNPSPITGSQRLYDAEYYILNSDFRVYICIDNGSSGISTNGNVSQVEPTFTELEPIKLSDGYTWKYLYTIQSSDIVKFDSTEYITLPNDWSTSTDSQIVSVRENGNSALNGNQIKKVFIKNPGLGYTTGTIACNLVGDGSGGTVSVTVNSSTRVSDVTVTSGGKNYTYALVDLGSITNKATYAELLPIIPPSRGHGYDLYKELGADRVLVYARFDDSTKDFPVDTKFAQIGIIKNPTIYDPTGISTTLYTQNEFSAVSSMQFSGSPSGTVVVGDKIVQSVPGGVAVGYVISYDSTTKVLKYSRDRSLYYENGGGFSTKDYIGITSYFSSTNKTILDFISPSTNPSVSAVTTNAGFSANISSFTGITTVVGNEIVNLGVSFTNGLAKPEINNVSADVIYLDNRSTVTRNSRQKEDIKIILEF